MPSDDECRTWVCSGGENSFRWWDPELHNGSPHHCRQDRRGVVSELVGRELERAEISWEVIRENLVSFGFSA